MNIPLSEDFKLGFACGAIVGCFFWIIDICVSIREAAKPASGLCRQRDQKKQMTSNTNNLKHDTMTLP